MNLFLSSLYFIAHALAAPACVTQFGGLHDFFAPIIVSAQSDFSATAHFRDMSPSERQRAIELVKQKILLAGRLGRTGEWPQLLHHMDDPKFMEGTGVTAYKPKAERIPITAAEAAELSTQPEKLDKLRAKMAGKSYWHDSGTCCSISAGQVEILDASTKTHSATSAPLSPLHRERALILTEEIGHHLQSLVQAQGGKGFVSRQMASPGFATEVAGRLKQHASQNLNFLMGWLSRSGSGQGALFNAIARFKAEHPVPDNAVSPGDHARFDHLPSQFMVLSRDIETGGIKTEEGLAFAQQVAKDVAKFFSAFPEHAAPVIDFVVEREIREADVYYLLQDLYGPQVIDVTWRNRYVGRRVGDLVLGRN